jgi:LPXTG-site transpeptidase (sortase) family protein
MIMHRGKQGILARHRAIVLIFIATLFAAAMAPLSTAANPSATFYVESTGHLLGNPFLDYWVAHNGVHTLGNPVTEEIGGRGGVTQYFEYGALRATPEGRVSRLPVGRELLALAHAPDATLGTTRRIGSAPRPAGYAPIVVQLDQPAIAGDPFYQVSNSVASFYERVGGRRILGRPLSNAHVRGDRTVQWFENGRIDVIDGMPRLGSTGLELAWSLGLDMSATQPGGALPFAPERYRIFTGDGAVPNADRPFVPRRVEIPKIGVAAEIEQVGITNSVMDAPEDVWKVGWYPVYAKPGEYTNVVMSGHRDWYDVGPVVFWNLHLLVPGDKIYVTAANGAGATYVVTTGWIVDADIDARTLTSDTGYEALTLITCGGTWNGREYTSRYVIRAERI